MFNAIVEKGHTPETAAKNQISRIQSLSNPTLGDVTRPAREFVASGVNAVLSTPDLVSYPVKGTISTVGTAGNVLAGIVNMAIGGTAVLANKAWDIFTLKAIRRGLGNGVRRILRTIPQDAPQAG